MTKRQTGRRQDATVREIDRRAFLKLGAAGGAGTLAAACGWDGGNAIRPNLLAVSRINDWVGERVLFSPTRLARTYSPAERSPTLPSYFISATTPMLKEPRLWRPAVDGVGLQARNRTRARRGGSVNRSVARIKEHVLSVDRHSAAC